MFGARGLSVAAVFPVACVCRGVVVVVSHIGLHVDAWMHGCVFGGLVLLVCVLFGDWSGRHIVISFGNFGNFHLCHGTISSAPPPHPLPP